MLCLHRLHPTFEPDVSQLPARPRPEPQRVRAKIGPLWKLMHVVEPVALPLSPLQLRDENNAVLIVDGPFAETKA
jgi:hypothetical protein